MSLDLMLVESTQTLLVERESHGDIYIHIIIYIYIYIIYNYILYIYIFIIIYYIYNYTYIYCSFNHRGQIVMVGISRFDGTKTFVVDSSSTA